MNLLFSFTNKSATSLRNLGPVKWSGEALARYALDGLPNKMLVREYLTALPPESALAKEINRARRFSFARPSCAESLLKSNCYQASVCGRQEESGVEAGEERIANRSRSATATPSRRRK